jgi:hypothetical protein
VGPGSGTGEIAKRRDRVDRWTMVFTTSSGQDYADQLARLGAWIAVPEETGYWLYKDLQSRPCRGEMDDLKSINRIFWVDDKPDSVMGLCRALGIKAPKPLPNQGPQVAVFFPANLEEQLAQLEVQALERLHPGRRGDDIKKTFFDVRNNEPTVAPGYPTLKLPTDK